MGELSEAKMDLHAFLCHEYGKVEEKAGKIALVSKGDMEDEHRHRHLASFRDSMREWKHFEIERGQPDPHKLNLFVEDLMAMSDIHDRKSFDAALLKLRKKHKIAPPKTQILKLIQDLPPINPYIVQTLKTKSVRSHSGVLVITVLTCPGEFSCPKDCHYCPNEPGQPRSYLSTEPAVLRGNQNGWGAAAQFKDRAQTLQANGHTIDKIEILVLGGTWSGYPRAYQEEFVRDLFYAANVFGFPDRPKLSLEEEQRLNETAHSRIIGLTLETRPDYINKYELRRMRKYGCTRVQIGIQHVDEEVLTIINRGCTLEQCVKAIEELKNAAFKVDIHLMPDLPGSNLEKDLEMFEYVLTTASLQADQWKIYPCEVTPFSTIEKWYKEGSYIPYTDEDPKILVELLLRVKRAVHPWIRLNRVVRDIPNQSIIGGNSQTNLRQILTDEMASRGLSCHCTRCREVKEDRLTGEYVLKIRHYPCGSAHEFFVSYESEDETILFGFLRLRLASISGGEAGELGGGDVNGEKMFEKLSENNEKINKKTPKSFSKKGENTSKKSAFPELDNSALVRELHVYGNLVGHAEEIGEEDERHQHKGLGRRLLLAADIISYYFGYRKIGVIAGIGTRQYYRRRGYVLEGTYMTKPLSRRYISDQMSAIVPFGNLAIRFSDLSHAYLDLFAHLPPSVARPTRAQRKADKKKLAKADKKKIRKTNKDIYHGVASDPQATTCDTNHHKNAESDQKSGENDQPSGKNDQISGENDQISGENDQQWGNNDQNSHQKDHKSDQTDHNSDGSADQHHAIGQKLDENDQKKNRMLENISTKDYAPTKTLYIETSKYMHQYAYEQFYKNRPISEIALFRAIRWPYFPTQYLL